MSVETIFDRPESAEDMYALAKADYEAGVFREGMGSDYEDAYAAGYWKGESHGH